MVIASILINLEGDLCGFWNSSRTKIAAKREAADFSIPGIDDSRLYLIQMKSEFSYYHSKFFMRCRKQIHSKILIWALCIWFYTTDNFKDMYWSFIFSITSNEYHYLYIFTATLWPLHLCIVILNIFRTFFTYFEQVWNLTILRIMFFYSYCDSFNSSCLLSRTVRIIWHENNDS